MTMAVKRINILCLTLFLLVSALLTLWQVLGRIAYLSDVGVVTDRRVDEGGTVYDLRDDEENTVWLREISPDGTLMAHRSLPKLDRNAYEYISWQLIKAEDGEAWLLETRYDIYEYTLVSETAFRYDFGAGKLEPADAPETSSGDTVSGEVSGMELLSVTFAENGVWAGTDGEYRLVTSAGGVIGELTVRPALLPDLDFVLRLAALIGLTAALTLLLRGILLGKRFPLMVKQALFALPVFTAGLVIIVNSVMGEIKTETFDDICHELIWRAELKLKEPEMSALYDIDWDAASDDEGFAAIRANLEASSRGSYIHFYDAITGVWYAECSYISFRLYTVKDGDAFTAVCGELPVGLPYDQAQKKSQRELLTKLLEDGEPVFGMLFGELGLGSLSVVMYPIKDGDGEIFAFLEAAIPYLQTSFFLEQTERSLTVRVTALMLAVTAAYLAVLYLALRRLGKLRRGTSALREGNYAYRVRVRGRDEIADIAEAFNAMAERVGDAVSNISGTSESYSRFVPREMFAVLDRETALDVKPGDSADVPAALLCLYTETFETYRGDDLFENLCRYYEAVMPAVLSRGGVIVSYTEDELWALFIDRRTGAAVRAAESAVKSAIKAAGDLNVECAAVIGKADIKVGVIGHGNRLSAAIVSPLVREFRKLAGIGGRLGCRILMTADAYADVNGAADSRFIGYAQTDGETAKPLYELLLEDSKRAGRDEFAHALKLYHEGSYYEARAVFIEVIKKSPQDLTAREYLLLSDALTQSPGEPKPIS